MGKEYTGVDLFFYWALFAIMLPFHAPIWAYEKWINRK